MKRGERRNQILELVKSKGEVGIKEVQGLGISANHASVTLLNMTRAGKLKRQGESRAYRYSLPDAA